MNKAMTVALIYMGLIVYDWNIQVAGLLVIGGTLLYAACTGIETYVLQPRYVEAFTAVTRLRFKKMSEQIFKKSIDPDLEKEIQEAEKEVTTCQRHLVYASVGYLLLSLAYGIGVFFLIGTA